MAGMMELKRKFITFELEKNTEQNFLRLAQHLQATSKTGTVNKSDVVRFAINELADILFVK